MFVESQSADPAIHALCIKIARRCVWIIQGCLRDEERSDALEAFYYVAREALEHLNQCRRHQ
jgi:hypothetical protein